MSRRGYENKFRSSHELIAIGAWLFSMVVLVVAQPPFWPLLVLFSGSMLYIRLEQIKRLWSFRAAISLIRMRTIKLKALLDRLDRLKKTRQILPLGRGFQWSQKHTEIDRKSVV